MKPVVSSIVLDAGLVLAAPQQACAEDPAHSRQQIQQVIKTFRIVLIKKDKETFLQLFLKDDITWTGVTTDGSIEMVANAPMPAEETLSNVRIDTGGEVAQAWFDYSCLDGS